MTKPSSNSPEHNADVARHFADVLQQESDAIASVALRADPAVPAAIELMHNCAGRLIVTGMGKMGCIARKAAATFSSTGTPAIFLHPGEAVHGDLGIVTDADVLLAISHSGETTEVLELIPFMKRHEIPVVALTGKASSTLARYADLVIDGSVEKEADADSLIPTCSTTVALAICDGLAMSLMKQRGFTREQFAIFHPGGQLGRKLLLTVQQLMHAGAELPTVAPATSLGESIQVISSGKLGAVFVVDPNQTLLGVLTDGDVRRVFESFASDHQSANTKNVDNPLDAKIETEMTADPTSIGVDALAAEALSLMEEREITVLPVVDGKQLVGVVHMHDLIRSGLA